MSTQSDQSTTVTRRLDRPRPEPQAGVFETTLAVDGRAVALDDHLRRLGESVHELYGQSAPPDLRELVAAAAAGTALGRLRVTVTPATGLAADVRVAAVAERLVLPGWDGAVELAPVLVSGGVGAHKWADRRLLERAEADAKPALPLLVDDGGALLETSRGNLFLVRGGALVTPPADGRLLAGITRAQVIEAARALGIVVSERPADLAGLAAADEAFLTGAVRGIEPVRRCAGVAEWSGPGTMTPRLAAELRRLWFG